MATRKPPKKTVDNRDQARDQWLGRLGALIDQVESWARELDWATRRISKKMEDSQLGDYKAPALLMQKETARILLDPIGMSTPDSEGLVDLYLMPAYDNVACLFFTNGGWQLHPHFSESLTVSRNSSEGLEPLTKNSLGEILDEMVQNAS